jgi:hypothetical protein
MKVGFAWSIKFFIFCFHFQPLLSLIHNVFFPVSALFSQLCILHAVTTLDDLKLLFDIIHQPDNSPISGPKRVAVLQ